MYIRICVLTGQVNSLGERRHSFAYFCVLFLLRFTFARPTGHTASVPKRVLTTLFFTNPPPSPPPPLSSPPPTPRPPAASQIHNPPPPGAPKASLPPCVWVFLPLRSAGLSVSGRLAQGGILMCHSQRKEKKKRRGRNVRLLEGGVS